jgi:hypothetical protein
MAGLLVQAREEQRRASEPPLPPVRVHRQSACGIELTLLQKLARAEATLQARLREHNWEADWDDSRKHHDLAEGFLNEGEWPDAFRRPRCSSPSGTRRTTEPSLPGQFRVEAGGAHHAAAQFLADLR